jgi:hypothetical protein
MDRCLEDEFIKLIVCHVLCLLCYLREFIVICLILDSDLVVLEQLLDLLDSEDLCSSEES